MKSLAFIFILIIAASCKNTYKINSNNYKYNDTLIFVDSLDFLTTENKMVLTNETAHAILLDYFKNKRDYYPEEIMTLDSLMAHDFDDDHMPMCIGFDTLYKTKLNNDDVLDGIVSYWDMPCGASGTCYLPQKAIIVSISDKYYITNTDFIPNNYSIDSIRQDKAFTYIYGNEFDCANHTIIRSYKARIKK